MSSTPQQVLETVRASGKITSEDVLVLRRHMFEDGLVSETEAQLLIDIETAAGEFDPVWQTLYCEALVDFTIHQAEPKGYVSPENAEWLIAAVTADEHTRTATEFEMLVKVIDAARWVPDSLTVFVLEQLKGCVLAGTTPMADGSQSTPGIVDAGEVELISRVLFAAGGDGHIAITRQEAEVLFDINDATNQEANAPAWSDLFIKAIVNHVMSASGYQPPSREEALRRESWLDERGSVHEFIARMGSGGFSAIIEAYRQETPEQRAVARLEAQHRQILLAEDVTKDEMSWVAERINSDGSIKENEKALLKVLLRKGGPSLSPWVDAMNQVA